MKQTWMLVGTLLLVLSGCTRNAEPEGTLFVSGRIDGDTVDISSKMAGRVRELTVREGDSVKADQILAKLDSPQQEAIRDTQKARIVSDQRKLEQLQRQLPTYEERIKQAEIYESQAGADAPAQVAHAEASLAASRAEVAQARAQLVRWEEELKQTQADAKRYAPLASTGAVAVQIVEQYQTRERVALASTDASRKQVAVAEAAVPVAEAALAQARAQLENPRIKAADRLTLMRQMDEAKAQIASAQADVEADVAALRKIEADLSDLTIRAPIDGTILTRSAEPGKVIQPGQTIFTMVDLTKLYLRGFVPEGNVGKVKVGQSAQVFLDSKPNEAIPAEVIRIDPQAMFTPENTYFQDDRVKQVLGLKLGLRGAVGFAKPGMPADGRIQIQGQGQDKAGSK
jgi:HlyD family secretion protein